MILWYLDRGSALVAYGALWLAAMTGVFHNARDMGALHRAARALHTPASVLASAAVLGHVALGTIDSALLLLGVVPHPSYSDAWFLGGVVIGIASLLLLVTAVLGFLDARSFPRPWDARTVHLFAYGGFAFASLHAIALGSDVAAWAVSAVVAASLFLVVALALRAAPRPG